MAREKSVSVRFSAVGGETVKAEMRGIGAAGKQAMQDIVANTRPASASLDEISATVARAREQLEQMAARAAAAASTMRATASAPTPMVAQINRVTGVTPEIGQSTADLLRQGQALDDLRAKFNPVFAAIRQYRQGVSEIKAAHHEGAISAEEMGTAIAALRSKALASIDTIKGLTSAKREAAKAAEQAALASQREAQRLDDLRARYNPVYAATRQYKASLAELNQLKAAGTITSQEYSQALEREAERMRTLIAAAGGADDAMQQMSRSSRGATLRMQNLFFQVNDIGVSLAGGMNPFVVMAQQGTQIAQIYGFGNGGVTGIFKDLGGMIARLPGPVKAVGIAAGLGALGIAGLRHEINEVSAVTVTLGDTALAVWQVISRGIWDYIRPAVDAMRGWFGVAWDWVTQKTKTLFNFLINGFSVVADFVGTLPEIIGAEFTRIVNVGDAAYKGMVAIWGALPAAIGDFAYSAANSLIGGVEAMLNGVVDRVNAFITGLNEQLAKLPDFVTGGRDLSIGTLGGVNLGRIANPFAGGAAQAGQVAAAAAAAIQTAAAGQNSAWAAFRNRAIAQMGENPGGELFDAIAKQAEANARDRLANQKGTGGGAGAQASEVAKLVEQLQRELMVLRETDPVKKKMLEYSDQLVGATDAERQVVLGLVQALDTAQHGWEAIGRSLAGYAESAKRIGQDIGGALVNAFSAAEDAVGQFVKTGKLNFRDLVSSLFADMAKLATRRFILGPLANVLGNALGGLSGGMLASIYHAGGMVGGAAPQRMVPAMAFAGAPRMHTGGWAGLKRDEVPAILQRGERVLSRREVREWGGGAQAPVNVTIMARDAESFRQSRTQVAADIARAISMGRRGM